MRRLLFWGVGAATVLALIIAGRMVWAPAFPPDSRTASDRGSMPPAPGDPSPAADKAAGPVPGGENPTDSPSGAANPYLADGPAAFRQAQEELAMAVGPADKAHLLQMPHPFPVKGIYVTADTLRGPRFEELLALVDRTELNAMVIDVKNDWGGISICTQMPGIPEQAVRHCVRDLPERLAWMQARGIYPIARIVTFKDNFMPAERPDLAVQHVGGGLWRDRKRQTWLNPYQRESWEYVVAIAKQAAAMGFKEIQFDYVRFPTDGDMKAVVYPGQDERPKWEVISGFLAYARAELRPYGALVSADIFGFILDAQNDQNIGQLLEHLAANVDLICPMVYPSHWGPGNLGLPNPNAAPYETVLRSMRRAQERLEKAGVKVTIRPWLQDFTLGHPPYTAEHVRAQIQATYDAGLEEWLLWNAGNRYTEGALLREP